MRKRYALTTVLSLLIIGAAWLPVVAQTEEPLSGQGLEITPPLIHLSADPGETVVIEIGLRNITDIDVVTRGTVNDFIAKDETGEPQILLDTNEASPYPLAAYIANVPSLQIKPLEQEVVRIPIVVPEDASPGAHMGVVRFDAVPADTTTDGSQVTLSASIGTLVLLNVSGDAEIALSVEELSVNQSGEAGELFETGPFTFITRLNNSGNVFLQPRITLRVSNMFGQEVGVIPLESETAADNSADEVSVIDVNPNERNVLPDSIRRFEQSVDKGLWFGRYTLTADVKYGPDDTSIESSVNFWVIPYKLVAIFLLLLVAIIYFGRRTLKTYKRNIIEKARRQEEPTTPSQPYGPTY